MTSPTPKRGDAGKTPIFILCGGLGTRIREQTETRPKPMIPLGERPILWHIMRSYAAHGFKKFVLCMGYKSEVIRDYFALQARAAERRLAGDLDASVD